MKEQKKEPFLCRWLGHDWIRYKDLDQGKKQACKCKRCGKVMYLGG